MEQKPTISWKLARRIAINAFIAFHIVGLFFWGTPTGPLRNEMVKPFAQYFNFAGLWHSWGMFAPMPLIVHFDLRGQVKYRDGSVAEWIAPRMQDLPVWQRAPKERFRKWREKIRTNDYKTIWPEAAQFVARQMNRNPANPPVEVKLVRLWVDLPRPDLKKDYQPMPTGYTTTRSFTFATVPIRPEDL